MRRILSIGMVVGLTACAASGPIWVKPGVTEGETSHEREACQRQEDSRMSDSGSYRYYEGDGSLGSDPMVNAETEDLRRKLDQAVTACMTAKGYKQVPGK